MAKRKSKVTFKMVTRSAICPLRIATKKRLPDDDLPGPSMKRVKKWIKDQANGGNSSSQTSAFKQDPIFERLEFLAIRNEFADELSSRSRVTADDWQRAYYIGRSLQNIYESSKRLDKIKIQWMVCDKKNNNIFSKAEYDVISFDSIITNIDMTRLNRNQFELPEGEKERIKKILEEILAVENGRLSMEEFSEEPLESTSGSVVEVIDDVVKKVMDGKSLSPKKLTSEKSKMEMQLISKVGNKKNKKLNPNPSIALLSFEPMFESLEAMPFISTIVNSKMLIRAVITGDDQLLESLLENSSQISSPDAKRSVDVGKTAKQYALALQNVSALKILIKYQCKDKMVFAEPPKLLLEADSTGQWSKYMFGHAMRNVNVSRGGREGNNAFLEDKESYHKWYYCKEDEKQTIQDMYLKMVKHNWSQDQMKELIGSNFSLHDVVEFEANVAIEALRKGNRVFAAEMIQEALRSEGYGYNQLHLNCLLNKVPLDQFRTQSVVKKEWHRRLTPMHCAAINPNKYFLGTLLSARPDVHLVDSDGWSLMHYAALSDNHDNLQLLISYGHQLNVTNKKGNTPLAVAVINNKYHNVRFILQKQKETFDNPMIDIEEADEALVKKMNKNNNMMNKMNRKGQTPVHIAAAKGFVQVLEEMISYKADLNKTNSAGQNCLMIAAAKGQLDIVKLLASYLTVTKKDRRGKSALTHAVINGQSHVVSYFLCMGCDPNEKDSSGNSLLHYACAYGWYFTWRLLIDAGAEVNVLNDWKVTPICVAYMKGHIGLVELMLGQGIDVDSKIDDNQGLTLLMATCQMNPGKEMLERLKKLVDEYQANVNEVDFQDNNVLHYLVLNEMNLNQEEENEFRYNVNEEKKKEFDAQRSSLKKAFEFILQKGGNYNQINQKKMTPIGLAIDSGSFMSMRLMMDRCDRIQLIQVIDNNRKMLFDCVDIADKTFTLDDKKKTNIGKYLKTKCKDNLVKAKLKSIVNEYNEEGLTAFHYLLKKIPNWGLESSFIDEKQVKNSNKKEENEEKLNDSEIIEVDEEEEEDDEEYNNEKSEAKKEQNQEKLTFDSHPCRDYIDFLENILQADINLLTKTKDYTSAFHLACKAPEFLKYLVSKNVIFQLDHNQRSALTSAIINHQTESARILIEAGAPVDIKSPNDHNRTLPQLDLIHNHGELIPLLLSKGADVNDIDQRSGNSLLHYCAIEASHKSAVDAVKSLISHGINLNAVNKQGRTALHLAVNSRFGVTNEVYDIECLLIKAGIDTTILDHRGRDALFYAFVKINKHDDHLFLDPIELVDLLDQRPSNEFNFVELIDEFGCSVLHYAASRGATVSGMHLLRDKKRFVNLIDRNGNTPLGLAVLYGHEACALMFLQNGAEFEAPLNLKPNLKPLEFDDRQWIWIYRQKLNIAKRNNEKEEAKYSIVQKVIEREWQGILYLMVNKVKAPGSIISAAIRTKKLQLACKLMKRINQDLDIQDGTLLHVMAKTSFDFSSHHLIHELIQLFEDNDIDFEALDNDHCTALVRSAEERQIILFKILYDKSLSFSMDRFNRTPLTAFFSKSSRFTEEEEKTIQRMVDAGESLNQQVNYCVEESKFKTVACVDNIDSKMQFTPLIVSVLRGNYSVVKFLLNIKESNGNFAVDVNQTDGQGLTALMHACRLNDLTMVKLLLDRSYDFLKEKLVWPSNVTTLFPDFSQNKTIKWSNKNGLNLMASDPEGRTALYYLLSPDDEDVCKANADVIFKLFVGCMMSNRVVERKSFLKNNEHIFKELLDLAFKKCALSVGEAIAELLKCYFQMGNLPKISRPVPLKLTYGWNCDLNSDSKKMIEQLDKKLVVDKIVQPDKLIGLDNLVVLDDSDQAMPFDTLLLNVDINYGQYGIYNFYKIQLVKQKDKDLILLFTRWGRVGNTGQYQKTPFGTVDEAVKEFKKIFKTKTGNQWEDVKHFQRHPKKYRLVNLDRRKKSKDIHDYKFNLSDNIKKRTSNLPDEILSLMKTLILTYEEKNPFQMRRDQQSGLGIINRETLVDAEDILEKISQLVKEKNAKQLTNKEYHEINNQISELSEEFYYQLPIFGFEYDQLETLDYQSAIDQKAAFISQLLYCQFANQVLLASAYRDQLNPCDYVYRVLNCNIELLEPSGEEAQMIMECFDNSMTNYVQQSIQAIYKVERQNPGPNHVTDHSIGNHHWLWHGTKTVNVLNILANGLRIAPPDSELSGHSFGKGIYFSDSPLKSWNYCDGSTKFMLLAEVALGKVQEVSSDEQYGDKDFLKPGFNSLKTKHSRLVPDPQHDAYWKGRIFKMGSSIINRDLPENTYNFLERDEYIIFDEKQVVVRYLIQMGDDKKIVSKSPGRSKIN